MVDKIFFPKAGINFTSLKMNNKTEEKPQTIPFCNIKNLEYDKITFGGNNLDSNKYSELDQKARDYLTDWNIKGYLKLIADNKSFKPQLQNLDLNNLDFPFGNFENADLSNTNLFNANLYKADLSSAKLENANLCEATLDNVTADINELRKTTKETQDYIKTNYILKKDPNNNNKVTLIDIKNLGLAQNSLKLFNNLKY